MDAGRCVSYLTIELRGADSPLADDLRRGIGNRIFGCDDCLDICPYNLQAEPTNERDFQSTSLTRAPSLSIMEKMTEQTFIATFKESPLRRAKYAGLQRNLSWARDNLGTPADGVLSPSKDE